jgi:lytic murein transglycosylase
MRARIRQGSAIFSRLRAFCHGALPRLPMRCPLLLRTPALLLVASLFAALVPTTPAQAAPCGGDFNAFIQSFSREAQAAGISARTISSALNGVTHDPEVMAFDRRQRATFRKSFEQYAASRVTPARVKRARAMLARHADLLARIESRFGVPRALIVAIWTMETDNGAVMGKLPVIRTVATLAHDCRRTELFQRELMAALQIVERGDMQPGQMLGGYAGEIGQTQFLPSSLIKYGVDYDGNGRVDLRGSVPDVLASTANLLKVNGWQAGAPFHMGTPNFEVMREWNRSELYRRTLVHFAEQLR